MISKEKFIELYIIVQLLPMAENEYVENLILAERLWIDYKERVLIEEESNRGFNINTI